MLERDSKPSESKVDYIYGVDLVRFVSAAGVAAYHLNESKYTRPWSVPFGWVGVQIFFVISGLVIANSARGASLQQFVVHRFLRLYPAAWCAAIVNLPLIPMAFWHEQPVVSSTFAVHPSSPLSARELPCRSVLDTSRRIVLLFSCILDDRSQAL